MTTQIKADTNNQLVIKDSHRKLLEKKLKKEIERIELICKSDDDITRVQKAIAKKRIKEINEVLLSLNKKKNKLDYDGLFQLLNGLIDEMTSTGWSVFKSTGYHEVAKVMQKIKQDLSKDPRQALHYQYQLPRTESEFNYHRSQPNTNLKRAHLFDHNQMRKRKNMGKAISAMSLRRG